MRRTILVVAATFLLLQLAAGGSLLRAHGGGLDSCGGHNDRKHGGYHVHNHAAYCRCNPSAADCKSQSTDTESRPNPVPRSGASVAVPTLEGLSARMAALEARVAELEQALSKR